jgi:signal transduction histidine kinase
MGWITYHIIEEYLIALLSLSIARRAFRSSRDRSHTIEIKSRIYLIAAGFVILGVSSLLHASIHAFKLDQNLLYQTLIGYCFGLLIIIIAVSAEKPWDNKYLPFLYFPLLILLHPSIYTVFPIFGKFRPLVWVIISYLSGLVCMLYIAVYYRCRSVRYLYSALGHAFVCSAAIMLFFPASIGSSPWIYGHLLRPAGFVILFFSMHHENLSQLRGSLLYRALTAFSLLASIPLLVYGTVILYENINPIDFMSRSVIVFVILLITLASALLFGLGMIINLIKPIIRLKDSVSMLVERGLNEKIEISSNDEIGELSAAYNDMVGKLRASMSEQDRLSRLAATGELSATLAHEIKNPLNAISVAATYIKNHYKSGLLREFINVIQNEALRINKLTTSLLNFAKPLEPEYSLHDINALVNETALLLKEEALERNVAIDVVTEINLQPFEFDYNQVKQVLLNLVINSLDAIDHEGRITIRTSASNGCVMVSVSDNGKGIAPQDMEKVFNPFFTTKTRGTGLGLSVSKKIAREHGGDLRIDSTPEQGSKFTLVLPVKP